jgi:hypothetical protein
MLVVNYFGIRKSTIQNLYSPQSQNSIGARDAVRQSANTASFLYRFDQAHLSADLCAPVSSCWVLAFTEKEANPDELIRYDQMLQDQLGLLDNVVSALILRIDNGAVKYSFAVPYL